VILQNPWGWHGVELLKEQDYVRRTYLCNIFLDPDFFYEIYNGQYYKYEYLYELDASFLSRKSE
jgi:hypothetical protein